MTCSTVKGNFSHCRQESFHIHMCIVLLVAHAHSSLGCAKRFVFFMVTLLVIVHLYNRSWNPVNLAPLLNDSELSLRETSLFHTQSCCETCYHLTFFFFLTRVQLSAHSCIQLWFQTCVQQEFKQILAKTQICLDSSSQGCTLTQFLILNMYNF